jgi:hypothetical protein
VEYSSCHPRSCKNGIPYSQAKRYRRIISDDHQLKHSLNELKTYFIKRNYPIHVIESAVSKVCILTQNDALNTAECTKDKNIIPFIIQYNPSLPNIGLIINKYWTLLNLSEKNSVKTLYKSKPILAYRRPRNLQDLLIRTKPTKIFKDVFHHLNATGVGALNVQILQKVPILVAPILKKCFLYVITLIVYQLM